jgi:ribosomal-protein-alanine N-acetyltransferase
MDAGVIRAGIAHAAAMAAIHQAAFPPAERWDAAAIIATVAMPGVLGLVAPAGGMALARVAADEAELLTLAVVPAARRRGLGGLLLRAAMRQAAVIGAHQMFLEVKDGNAAALALYTQAGFAVIASRRQYYPDGAAALVLRASLMPGG